MIKMQGGVFGAVASSKDVLRALQPLMSKVAHRAAVEPSASCREVRAVFLAYEAALLANDVRLLNDFFLDSPSTVRYGIAEHNYGAADIALIANMLCQYHLCVVCSEPFVTTCGRDTACVSSEFSVPASELIGRQTQTWVRFDTGWKLLQPM